MKLDLALCGLLLGTFSIIGCTKPNEKREGSSAPKTTSESPTPTAEALAKPSAAPAPSPSGAPVEDLKLPTLPELVPPANDPPSEAKIALGHQLFFDARLSVDGSVSCYSCHQNEHGNGGETPVAIGAKKKKLTRHSPTIWNVGYLPRHYWDGRAETLEAQVKGAWSGGNMGVGKEGLLPKAKEIAAIPGYEKEFAAAFPGEAVTEDLVARAIAAYVRTLICNDTAYDRYAAGDRSALSAEQKAGLGVFLGKGMCSACHAPPHFSTAYFGAGAFFNVGIGTVDASGKPLPEAEVDVGRMAVTEKKEDWAAFKPPTLRNVTKSAPYFHDGHVTELRAAVKLMASGGYDNPNKTPLMTDKQLTDEEIDQLVTFLGALECGGKLETPKLP